MKLSVCATTGVKKNVIFTSGPDYKLVMGESLKLCNTPTGLKLASTDDTPVSLDANSKQLGISKSGAAVTFSQKDYYNLQLNKIEYDKKVYSPGDMKLSFCVSSVGSPSDPLSQLLKMSFIDTQCVVEMFGIDCHITPSAAQPVNRVFLAQNYFVNSVSLRYEEAKDENGKVLTCVLQCYSFDYKLKLDSYCTAYTGKKFGNDIFNTIPQLGIQGLEIEYKKGKLLWMGYDKTLKYRSLKPQPQASTKEHDEEIIHPYLVQYNESYYDFISRVAHRCGEFMYFDHGKLQLGLPQDTIQYLSIGYIKSPPGSTNKVLTISPSPLCSYDAIGGNDKTNVTGFTTDYTNKNKPEVTGKVFDMEYASDEYTKIITANDNKYKESGSFGDWIAYKAVGTVLNCDDFITGLTTAVITYGWDYAYSKYWLRSKVSKAYDKSFIKNVTKEASELASPNSQMVYNICNHFYHQIERLEKMEETHKVSLDFSNSLQNKYLGDVVDIKDGLYDAYVITRMHGSFTHDSTDCSSHYAEAVPIFRKAIFTIDDLERVVAPPREKIAHTLSASPMEALVSKNNDPLRMNRVRVKFPWQKSDDKNFSPWIRVAVPFAGSTSGGQANTGGFTMTPSEGEHVMLNFVDGNIERPFVDGSLYDISNIPQIGAKTNVPATYNAEHQTQAIISAKGHGITFKDAPDSNLIMSKIPLWNTIRQCKNAKTFMKEGTPDQVEGFGKNAQVGLVKGGGVVIADGSYYCSISVDANKQAISVNSDYGTVDISAFTGITVTAPNGDITIKGKNVSIEAGNNLSLRAGTNIKKEAKKGATLGMAIASSLASAGMSAIQSWCGVDLKNCFDVSYLRHIYEIFMRPVEGTLSIQSNRNVVMTAGDGKVSIPSNLLSDAYVWNVGGVGTGRAEYNTKDVIDTRTLKKAVSAAETYIDGILNNRNVISQTMGNLLGHYLSLPELHKCKSQAQFLEVLTSNNVQGTPATIDTFLNDAGRSNVDSVGWYNQFKKDYAAFWKKSVDFKKLVRDYEVNFFKAVDFCNINADLQHLPDGIKRITRVEVAENSSLASYIDFVDTEQLTKKLKRAVVVKILQSMEPVKVISAQENANQIGTKRITELSRATPHMANKSVLDNFICDSNNLHWADIAQSLDWVKPEAGNGILDKLAGNPVVSTVLGSVAGAVGLGSYDKDSGKWTPVPSWQKLLNINGAAGPRSLEEISTSGNILVSNSSGESVSLTNNGQDWEHHPNFPEAAAVLRAVITDLNLN